MKRFVLVYIFTVISGDPNDRSLRKVEKDVLIPKLMREITRAEKCANEVNDFNECCVNFGLRMIIKCRKENAQMKTCMEKWYYNDDFIKECTEQYLNERSEYRRTGIPKKGRNKRLETSL
ncbi:Uncharacterized protein C3orf68-like protein [Harpegnathos saltator]|uniref:COX assembly mitochondrial protein n=1 Tax=Harpegnathos saltator TaxID=610380 RepID=E2BD79_HARSA|nr:Uncharacterized protein C3orf68-like protein [Harpegnathos saltator]